MCSFLVKIKGATTEKAEWEQNPCQYVEVGAVLDSDLRGIKAFYRLSPAPPKSHLFLGFPVALAVFVALPPALAAFSPEPRQTKAQTPAPRPPRT